MVFSNLLRLYVLSSADFSFPEPVGLIKMKNRRYYKILAEKKYVGSMMSAEEYTK